jgi:peroxiredoxin family protein
MTGQGNASAAPGAAGERPTGDELEDGVTIVVFSGDMDKVQAAFNIATGAASMGMKATLFFTFWGLGVLKRNDVRGGGRGLLRKMMNIMNRGGSRHLPLSRFHMFGLGPWMMHKLMAGFKMPTTEEMIRLAKEMGVKLVACTVTMELMGVTKEMMIPEVDTYAGVVTYLSEAKKRRVNLFI